MTPQVVVHDVQVGVPPGISTKGIKPPTKPQKPTILTYEHKQFRSGFTEPEYDLSEIYKAMDTDSYLRLSFDKHEELILKGRWKIVGQNEKTLAYALRRLTEIGWSQNEPFERIIEAGIEDLVESHNVFYALARRETGKTYTSRFGRRLYPITGIFSPNSSSMRPFIKTLKNGTKVIAEWWQVTGGRLIKKFRPYNIVHMAFRKKKGHIFGTPFVIPVLDDILAMRRMEELVEILTHKHAFPFFHYRVGTENEPAREYDDGHSEVDDIRAEVEGMPFEGGLVTPYRHEIVVLGTKNKAVNAEPYLKYYEARVLSGLNLSGIDIGRGETANRATAQTMSRGLSDRCTRFQNFFATWFNFMVLDELIYEMGEVPTPENRVYLVFPTIDKEEERAQQNHTTALYQANLITETEARVDIGRDPFKDEQRKDLHYERVAKELAIISAPDEPYTAEAKKSMTASANQTKQKTQPTNQSGTKSTKPKVAANDAIRTVAQLWDGRRNEMLADLDGVRLFISDLEGFLEYKTERLLGEGLQRYVDEFQPKRDLYVGSNVVSAFQSDVLEPKLLALDQDLRLAVDSAQSQTDRAAAVDSSWPLIDLSVRQLTRMAENYGYARAAQVDKRRYVKWELSDNACDECRAKEPLRIRRFSWEDLTTHDQCNVKLVVVE